MPGTGRTCRVWWNTLNREVSGVVERETAPDTYLVRLGGGKCSIVHKSSIRRWEEQQSE